MIKLKKILVPTDFSDNSRLAIDYGAALAEQFESEIHLIYVLQDVFANVPAEPGMYAVTMAGMIDELKESAKASLQQLAESPPLKGKRVSHHLRGGNPFVEIVDYARDQGTDLIVMATHGRSGLAHVLVGSVAERVVRKAACPVLTVRPSSHQFVEP